MMVMMVMMIIMYGAWEYERSNDVSFPGPGISLDIYPSDVSILRLLCCFLKLHCRHLLEYSCIHLKKNTLSAPKFDKFIQSLCFAGWFLVWQICQFGPTSCAGSPNAESPCEWGSANGEGGSGHHHLVVGGDQGERLGRSYSIEIGVCVHRMYTSSSQFTAERGNTRQNHQWRSCELWSPLDLDKLCSNKEENIF